jgi:hypothetical protein
MRAFQTNLVEPEEVLVDWRTPKLRDPNYSALTRRRAARLFGIGRQTRMVGVFRGALVPPIGRFLSIHLPNMYFLVQGCLPLLVGQVAYLLQKNPA